MRNSINPRADGYRQAKFNDIANFFLINPKPFYWVTYYIEIVVKVHRCVNNVSSVNCCQQNVHIVYERKFVLNASIGSEFFLFATIFGYCEPEYDLSDN